MISQSIQRLTELLRESQIPADVVERIVIDVKHNVERLPSPDQYKVENGEIVVAREVGPSDYAIMAPVLTSFTADFKRLSLEQYFEQNADQLVSVAMSTGMYTFPEQLREFDVRRLNAHLRFKGSSEDKRELCYDDLLFEGDRMDLSDNHLGSLEGGFSVQPFGFIRFVDFSNNFVTYEQIERFLREMGGVKAICADGIELDPQAMARIEEMGVSIILQRKENIQEQTFVHLINLTELPQEAKAHTVFFEKEMTTDLFNAVLPGLRHHKIQNLVTRFAPDFDFSLLDGIPFVNFEPCVHPQNVKYSQGGQMMLELEQVQKMARGLAEHCLRRCFLMKQKDFTEKYDENGVFSLENQGENFAIAVYPSLVSWAEKAFSASNPELSVNSLQVAHVLPSGDLAQIFVPLRTLQPGRALRVNGKYKPDQEQFRFEMLTEGFRAGRIAKNELFFEKLHAALGQTHFGKARLQLACDIDHGKSPSFVFEATDFGIVQFVCCLNGLKKKNDLAVQMKQQVGQAIGFTDGLRRVFSMQEALTLLMSRTVRFIALFIIQGELPETMTLRQIAHNGSNSAAQLFVYHELHLYPSEQRDDDAPAAVGEPGIYLQVGDALVLVE